MTANPPKSRCCLPVTSFAARSSSSHPHRQWHFRHPKPQTFAQCIQTEQSTHRQNTTATFRFPDSGMVCLPQPSACAYACGFPSCFMIWLSLFPCSFPESKSPEDPARSPLFLSRNSPVVFLLSVYRFLCSYYASPFINPSTQSL